MGIKTNDEIAIMRMGGRILADTLEKVSQYIKPNITLKELDQIAQEYIESKNAQPSFLGYSPEGASFPYRASICASVNDSVVHGIPNGYKLKDGDIITIDLGVYFKGYHTDSAKTFIVGTGSKEARHLLETTEAALYLGIQKAKAGNTLGDIGYAIESYAKKNKIKVIEGLTGHGIGRNLHELPTVLNTGKPGAGLELKEGMTIAIEPMFAIGSKYIIHADDDSYKTEDDSLSAHFEHTIAITKGEPEILTK